MNDIICSRELSYCSSENDNNNKLLINILRPCWKDEGVESSCIVQIVKDSNPPSEHELIGVDLLNAVESAVKFVESYLENFGKKHDLFWLDGKRY